MENEMLFSNPDQYYKRHALRAPLNLAFFPDEVPEEELPIINEEGYIEKPIEYLEGLVWSLAESVEKGCYDLGYDLFPYSEKYLDEIECLSLVVFAVDYYEKFRILSSMFGDSSFVEKKWIEDIIRTENTAILAMDCIRQPFIRYDGRWGRYCSGADEILKDKVQKCNLDSRLIYSPKDRRKDKKKNNIVDARFIYMLSLKPMDKKGM